ncbi:MAG TPA: GTP-binding protein [Steroidobacteraceae bacterium]|nr:GTP-binding protein [Steroidobacteraceae bacterium]
MSARVPVTVLTGFLGSGKTTLVNRILSEQHGRRIAVIENEFGEVGVDHELVIGADEEIFETSNGCICCTVRGDLIRILAQLRKRRERFDAILIETTGLADPGPVAQTFFIDEELREHYLLDAIVTLVDARHIEQQLKSGPVALEQIGFADLLLLNKTDLVSAAVLSQLERRLRAINGTATIVRTHNADVALERVLNVGAFDLERALARDEDFLEPARPFEWAGLYTLPAGEYVLQQQADNCAEPTANAHEHDHDYDHHHGPEPEPAHTHGPLRVVDLLLLPAAADVASGEVDATRIDALVEDATRRFGGDAVLLGPHAALPPQVVGRLELDHARHVHLQLPRSGSWVLFCEHTPAEFGGLLPGWSPAHERSFGSHHHDAEIGSIGLTDPRPLDPGKINAWLSYLLQSRGQDILRMKGVLNFAGEARRYVFHGVHMVFDGQLEREWPPHSTRCSRLVFIGRGLDRAEFEAGFESCVA